MATSDSDAPVYAAQAAKIAGVSKTAIFKAVDRGHISKDAAGRIARADLKRWMESRRPARGTLRQPARQPDQVTAQVTAAVTGSAPPEVYERVAEIMARPGAIFASRAEADLHRASYDARMREVEYDLRIGKVVLSDEIARILGQELAVVRPALLAIAVNVSPRLALLTDPAEIEAVLTKAIQEALAALTADTEGGAAAVIRLASAVAPGILQTRAQR